MRANRWRERARMAFCLFACLAVCRGVAGDERREIHYGVIGDSYSIGEGASCGDSWPAVLARDLMQRGIPTRLVANPSRTGWTTEQAIDAELPVFTAARPTFATIQIGVNDLVQGVSPETFRARLDLLLDRVEKVIPDKRHLLLVTIPDFTVTPAGKEYSPGGDAESGLAEFNRIITSEGKSRGIAVVDVLPSSRAMATDPALVASDGLHPSAREYADWEKIIFPAAFDLLSHQ